MKQSRFNGVEALEARGFLAATPWSVRVNFQPAGVPVPDYCRADSGASYGLRANGLTYGWSADNAAGARDRNAPNALDQRYDTLNHLQRAGANLSWEIAVPSAGNYTVRVVAGDPSYFDSVYRLNVEGLSVVSGTPTSAKRWVEGTRVVSISDGRLTLSNALGAVNNKVAFIEIIAGGTISPADGTLTWARAASHPLPRTEQMTAFVAGRLYVLGGYVNQKYLSVSRVDVYDPAADAWSRGPDIPQPLSHAGTAADDRYIYLAGGYTVDSTGTRQVFGMRTVRRLDTVTGTWSRLPDLPVSRGAGSSVIVGRTLYHMGGLDGRMQTYLENYALNLDDPSAGWHRRAPLPEANNHFGMAVLSGKVYVIGGQSGNDATAVFKRTCYRYDPAADTWAPIASLPAPARSHIGPTTVVLNGRIYAMGGEADGPAPGVPSSVKATAVYNPATNAWSQQTALPAARSGGVAAAWGDRLIFTAGLSNGVFCSDTWIGTFR